MRVPSGVQQAQRQVLFIEQPEFYAVFKREGDIVVVFQQILVDECAAVFQLPEIITGVDGAAFQAVLQRPAAVAYVTGLYFMTVGELLNQAGIAYIDVPVPAIGGDGFRPLVFNDIHHPAKGIQQALCVAPEYH